MRSIRAREQVGLRKIILYTMIVLRYLIDNTVYINEGTPELA